MEYRIKIEKVGRRWLNVLVTGKTRTYHAQIEKRQLPDAVLGAEMTIEAKFTDLSTRYGKKFQLDLISPEELRRTSIEKWWGLLNSKFVQHGYIYDRAIEELHQLDCHEYDGQIKQMKASIEEKKEKTRQERTATQIQEAQEQEEARRREELKYSHLALAYRVTPGDDILFKEEAYHVVSCCYQSEDGFSFGVLQDEWYQVKAINITETDKGREMLEAEAIRRENAKKLQNAKAAAEVAKKCLTDTIKKLGSCPERCEPSGDVAEDTMNIYGGGDQVIVGQSRIWYVVNNGMDGDDWSRNNIQTGGAGAIGYECNLIEVQKLLDEYLDKNQDLKVLQEQLKTTSK